MPFSIVNVKSQKAALLQMAKMIERAIPDPVIVAAARSITVEVDARDDEGELQAIFDAVKTGTTAVEGLEKGVRYVADPRDTDYYIAPVKLLQLCAAGGCASDCDEQAMLVCALAGAIGFPVGLRAYAPAKGQDFEHVYAVASYPKNDPTQVVGLDTTVPSSTVGWEPPAGYVLTAWVH
jgi:hypothetical protein